MAKRPKSYGQAIQLSGDHQLSLTFESVMVSEPITVNPNEIILKSPSNKTILIREPLNLLTSTSEFGFFERRLYWLVLKELRHLQATDRLKIKPYEEIKFSFHYSQVIKGHSNETIKKLMDKLQQRTISWEDDTGKHTNVVVFPMAEYWPGKGKINLTMYHAVIPVFLYLGNGYSQFGFEDALMLSSEYAQLLFSYLSRFRGTGFWRINLADLRKAIGAKEKSYNAYSAFRTRVIDLSLKQINEHTNLNVSYEPIQQGRSVIGIEFKIEEKASLAEKSKEQRKQEVKQVVDELLQKDIAELIGHAAEQLHRYYGSFTAQQRKSILTNAELLKAFIRADVYVEYGFADKDPDAYVAQSVFNYKKVKPE